MLTDSRQRHRGFPSVSAESHRETTSSVLMGNYLLMKVMCDGKHPEQKLNGPRGEILLLKPPHDESFSLTWCPRCRCRCPLSW